MFTTDYDYHFLIICYKMQAKFKNCKPHFVFQLQIKD